MRFVQFGAVTLAISHGIMAVVTSGCGSAAIPSAAAADAQVGYDRGTTAFQRGDYAEAMPHFTTALETPGLPPDLIVDAMLKRAQCRAGIGDFPAALAEIELAEQGATELDKVHLTRGIVYQIQGDETAARDEFAKARRFNRDIRLP